MTVNVKDMKEALKKVKGFVSANNGVLSKIRLNNNRMIATDLTKAIQVDIEFPEIDILVDFKDFSTLINKTRFETVECQIVEDGLELSCTDYVVVLSTMNSDKFPDVDFLIGELIPLPSEFRTGLAMCIDSVSTDETRYFMQGVYCDAENTVGTDGFRMMMYKLDDPMPEMIIPSKTVHEFLNLDLTEYVFDEDQKRIRFSGYDGMIVSSLIEGTFPNYKRLIPGGNEGVCTLELSQDMLVGADIVSNFRDNRVVTISILKNELRITAANDRGHILFKHFIETDGIEDEFSFDINLDYFLDALKVEEVTLKLFGNPVEFIQMNVESYVAIIGCIKSGAARK